MALPTTAFDATKTIVPRKSFVQFTPSPGGVDGTPVDLVCTVVDYAQSVQKAMRKVPGGAGTADSVLRPDRIVFIEQEESISIELEEFDDLQSIFGAGRLSGAGDCKVKLWVVDPDDAATKAAIVSNQFKAFYELDGSIGFKVGEVAKVKIKFTAKEQVQLTVDATA